MEEADVQSIHTADMDRRINRCQKCGYVWIGRLGVEPKRCVSARCRTSKWKNAANGKEAEATIHTAESRDNLDIARYLDPDVVGYPQRSSLIRAEEMLVSDVAAAAGVNDAVVETVALQEMKWSHYRKLGDGRSIVARAWAEPKIRKQRQGRAHGQAKDVDHV